MERKRTPPTDQQHHAQAQSSHEKKSKKVVPFLLVAAIIVIALLVGKLLLDGTVSEEAKIGASVIVDAFEKDDILSITQCIYGEEVDDTAIDSSGLMSALFTRTNLEVSSLTKDTITYVVSAADVSQLFNDWIKDTSPPEEIDDAGFVSYIAEYVRQAEMTTETVRVSYTIEDGAFIANYASFEFLDAVTGHFLTAYEEQYTAMMDGYREALREEVP